MAGATQDDRACRPRLIAVTRILLVTRNLPPLLGGMERLNWHMAAQLAERAEVRVIGPSGCAALAPPGVEVQEVPLQPLPRFLLTARRAARSVARAWRPHWVLAGSGLTAPAARSAARCCDAAVAVYVHGLDVAVRHPLYRALWHSAIRRADRVIANSRATAARCAHIGVAAERLGIVHPGVEWPPVAASTVTLGSASAPADNVRQRLNLGRRPLLLSVGRLTRRKGLREFVTQALPCIVAAQPEVLLLIVGDAPRQSLHATAQSPDSIRSAAEAVGVADNIRFLGAIHDDIELSHVYAAATVHVFPVRSLPGDPEGFGMVAIEAAAHGLPTVAFATGGVNDAVAEGRSGWLIAPGDYAAFSATTVEALSGHAALRAPCIEFAAGFSWSVFGQKLAELLALS